MLSRNIPIFATGVEKEEEEVCLIVNYWLCVYGRASWPFHGPIRPIGMT